MLTYLRTLIGRKWHTVPDALIQTGSPSPERKEPSASQHERSHLHLRNSTPKVRALRGEIESEDSELSDLGLLDCSDELEPPSTKKAPPAQKSRVARDCSCNPLTFLISADSDLTSKTVFELLLERRTDGRPFWDLTGPVEPNSVLMDTDEDHDEIQESDVTKKDDPGVQQSLLLAGYHPADDDYDADAEDMWNSIGSVSETRFPPDPNNSRVFL